MDFVPFQIVVKYGQGIGAKECMECSSLESDGDAKGSVSRVVDTAISIAMNPNKYKSTNYKNDSKSGLRKNSCCLL